MLIYYILIVVMTALYLLLCLKNDRKYIHVINLKNGAASAEIENAHKKRKALYVLMMGLSFFLVMALSAPSVGVDIYTYKMMYEIVEFNYSFRLIFQHIFTRYYFTAELLYFLATLTFSYLNLDFQWFIAVYSLFIAFCVSRVIYKYSDNVFLSFLFYLSVGLFAMSMSGLRQMIAIGVVSIAFDYIIDKKPIRYFLLVFIAIGFHASAIIMLPMYFFRGIRISHAGRIVLYVLVIIASVAALAFVSLALNILPLSGRQIEYLSHAAYFRVNPLIVIMQLVYPLIVIMLLNKKTLSDKASKTIDIMFFFLLIEVGIMILTLRYLGLARLGYYFKMFFPVIMANSIHSVKTTEKRWVFYIPCVMLLLMFIAYTFPGSVFRIGDYRFFWQ